MNSVRSDPACPNCMIENGLKLGPSLADDPNLPIIHGQWSRIRVQSNQGTSDVGMV